MADTAVATRRGFAAYAGRDQPVRVDTWGLGPWPPDQALLLSATARRHEQDIDAAQVHRWCAARRGAQEATGQAALAQMLPTFAAAARMDGGGIRVVTDPLGFRQVFHGSGNGAAAVSTSSRACARALGRGLDLEAVAVQSVLGWQLGERSLYAGIRTLGPGGTATLSPGGSLEVGGDPPPIGPPISLEDAVDRVAQLLRTFLAAYLEDHPEAGLQLTGGQDSRLLLSAVPPPLRRGLRVVTLGVAGEADLDIAAELAAHFGMRHEVLTFDGLEDVEPARAYALCLEAAHRLDYSADPLARAALTYAESRSEPGPRISGLGGEVARGFYYLGPPTGAAVSERRARRLARWRMFVNEATPAQALREPFASWARAVATDAVVEALTGTGRGWMDATDDLYLLHRMHRWGGVTETAVCLDRPVVNPMLDDRFIAIARALSPRDKRGSRFLSRLQVALDPELAARPMDGRPPPSTYARASVANTARQSAATLRKARHKVVQRVRRENRPPAGGELLAAKVVEHWRAEPAVLEPVLDLDLVHPDWIGRVLEGDSVPPTSAVALLVTLSAALDDSPA